MPYDSEHQVEPQPGHIGSCYRGLFETVEFREAADASPWLKFNVGSFDERVEAGDAAYRLRAGSIRMA